MVFAMLLTGLVVHLAVISPWWGTRSYRKLERERSGPLYIRMMSLWIGELWALAAVSLLLVAISPELDLARIGLAEIGDPMLLAGMITGAAVVGGVSLLVLAKRGVAQPGAQVYSALLPRDRTERWYAAALAISAGVCEEILYRGVLIAVGVHVLGLSLPVAAGLSLALFAIGHLYQGLRGMLAVLFAGFCLTWLYLRTGSLVPVILLHILIDLRAFLFTPATRADRKEQAAVAGN
nr:MAG: CPBP family intramembrane metalloprotease [Actinomycetota bacterium]